MWIYNNERPHQGLNNLTPPPNAKQDNDDENQWKNLILKRS
jgi:transposase InsO family protein